MKKTWAILCFVTAPVLLLAGAVIAPGFKSERLQPTLLLAQQVHAHNPTEQTAHQLAEIQSTIAEMQQAEFNANLILGGVAALLITGTYLLYASRKHKN